MSVRAMVLLLVALAVGVGAGVLLAGGDDDDKDKGGATTAAQSEFNPPAIPPDPFKAGLKFWEPPPVRSTGRPPNRRLRATITAQNGVVDVSGLKVAGTQTYSAEGPGGSAPPAFLGPTLHAEPGDTVELTLDNKLTVPAGADPTKPAQNAENCGDGPGHDTGHEEGAETQAKPGDPEVTNLHFHGLHVTPRQVSPYGDTVLVRLPNGKSQFKFKIPPTHDKGTFWYHSHVHRCTNDQVTRGLAGLLLIGDSRENLPEPLRKIETRSLALKDVQVVPAKGEAPWQIDPAYNFTDSTHRTVNGLVNPKMEIRPNETQMWRLLNASSAVWYQVVLVDESKNDARDKFTVVAQDGNPLLEPKEEDTLLVPPGARFDILVRGPASGGKRVLKTLEFDQGFAKFPEDVLATVDVKGAPAPQLPAPDKLPAPHQRFPKERGPTRRFTFDIDLRDTQFHISDTAFNPNINNADFDPGSPDATPILETTERWIIYNKSAEWHPFHIHQDDFRVVKGGQPQLPGDHDIVALPPGTPTNPSVTEIEMPFTDFAGNFVFHCHILVHEDLGMMSLVELRERGHER